MHKYTVIPCHPQNHWQWLGMIPQQWVTVHSYQLLEMYSIQWMLDCCMTRLTFCSIYSSIFCMNHSLHLLPIICAIHIVFVEVQRGKKWSAAKHADQSVRTMY